ncbi:MAG: PAS domain S-box protein, partial [Pseudomonadota bacterium]
DDLVTAFFVEQVLREEGFIVRRVSDGRQGLEEIHAKKPDVIFLDLVLPKISGESLIRHIREAYSKDNLLIVVVTATVIESNSTLQNLNVNAVIPKGPPESFRDDIIEVCRSIKQNGKNLQDLSGRLRAHTFARRVVKELLDSRDYHNRMIESLSNGFIIIDIDFKIIKFNTAATGLMGTSASDLLGKSLVEILEKGERSFVEEKLSDLFSDKPLQGSCRTIVHNSRLIDFKISGITDVKTGKTIAGIVLIEDVTERKLLEKSLREAEEQYRTIVNTVPDIIYHLDSDGKFIFVNFAVEDLGYSREELVGKSFLEIVHPDDKECARHVLNERRTDPRESNGIELRLIPKDTKDAKIYSVKNMPVIITARGLYSVSDIDINNPQKRYLGTQGVAHDITKRKRMEQVLIKAQEDWERTFDSIPDCVVLVDINHKIVRLNKAAADLAGLGKADLLGSYCQNASQCHGYPDSECPLKQSTRDGLPHSQEVFAKGKKGKTYICTTSPIIDENREALGYSVSLCDITESKRLYERYNEVQKMKTLGTLAGGIAHDFNNLLMGIQGYTSLMLLKVDPLHPHFQQLKKIESQVALGSDLTRQLLGFARGGKYQVAPIDLNKLVEKSIDVFGKTKRNVCFRANLNKNSLIVEVDQYQIEQALFNLYANACEAMSNGGDIIVETKSVVMDDIEAKGYQVKPGQYAHLAITDTGSGINPEFKDRIFEPFFTTKEMGHSAGLGLASAYGIVRNHSGAIDVESELGNGSTFQIYLPISDKALIKKQEITSSLKSGKETILLVDDDLMVREIGSELLSSLGYKVISADSGKKAVEILHAKMEIIDLVILDMIMPEMDGCRTYRAMKDINPDIKVILASGYSRDSEAEKIIAEGVKEFLQKPFNLAELSQSVRSVFDSMLGCITK